MSQTRVTIVNNTVWKSGGVTNVDDTVSLAPVRIAALVMDRLGLENTDLAEVGRQLLKRAEYRLNIYMQWLMNECANQEELEANKIQNQCHFIKNKSGYWR
jgi:hypothetical protein